ncbi:MAG: o-succinylbenzoate--CoA ligase [Rubrobacteraceae bacterium]
MRRGMEIRDREIPCPLREKALETPHAPAIVEAGGIMAYAELDARVSSTARLLREAGYETGSRVAIHLTTDARYVVLLLALLRIGTIACPISQRLPVRAVSSLARRIGCHGLISEDRRLADAINPDDLVVEPGFRKSEEERSDRLWIPLDRAATVVATSGSSGRPKAALHTFGNHYYSALGSGTNITLSGGDRWLLSLPLYHVGGLSILFRCLLAGAAVVIPEPAARTGHSIATLNVTHVSLVATQLRRLLDERVNLGDLKTILLGGGPVPDSLVEAAVARNLPVHTSYGLTEMASQVTTTPPGVHPDKLKTAGKVLPNREVSISEYGEILVRGDTLFAGYVEGGGLDLPTDQEGWFHTGDLGALDPQGYLQVLGRKDNLFVSGGENIQPEEIEEALTRLPGVEKAVVAPVPDAEFGERPVAFVLAAYDSPAFGDLASKLEETLPRFKIPIAVHDWPKDVDPERAKVDRPFFKDLARGIHKREMREGI